MLEYSMCEYDTTDPIMECMNEGSTSQSSIQTYTNAVVTLFTSRYGTYDGWSCSYPIIDRASLEQQPQHRYFKSNSNNI